MATTVPASTLLPFVAPDVPEAPEPLVLRNIMLAANDYCVQTGVWDEIQDPVTILDNIHTYDIDTPTGAQVATIKDIWLANRKLIPVSMDQLMEKMPNWQSATGSEPAYYNAASDWTTYRIYPIPYQAQKAKMTLRVAYAPDQFGDVVPRFLVDRWLDEVVAGAKARLLAMVGKPWTNAAAAQFFQRQYEQGILDAKIFMAHDKVLGSVSVKPVRMV